MELKRIILFLSIFLFCLCSSSAFELNKSISVLVKNDKDIERLYSQLLSIQAQVGDNKEFKNEKYDFLDQKCNRYVSKQDTYKRQRKFYRCIHFYNLSESENIQIQFYQTKGMDVEIRIYYSKKNGTSDKCIIGKYDLVSNSYIFDEIRYLKK